MWNEHCDFHTTDISIQVPCGHSAYKPVVIFQSHVPPHRDILDNILLLDIANKKHAVDTRALALAPKPDQWIAQF
jgi:hypothetical protein